jgi:hypothetical protein
LLEMEVQKLVFIERNHYYILERHWYKACVRCVHKQPVCSAHIGLVGPYSSTD